MKFSENDRLTPNVLKALSEMGFEVMTQIQEKSIPVALDGYDIIGQAQTGTGKTASFGIPIVNSINEESKPFEHLIIAPTRELATQIFHELIKLSKFSNAKIALILGGISYDRQGKFLNERPHVIVATPGRLNDYLTSKRIKLDNLKTFTLDEADELLNIGFQKEIESIISFLPKKRQNFFFTATFNEKTKKLAKMIMNSNAHNISVSQGLTTNETIKQEYVIVKEKNKWITLVKLLEFFKPKSTIIFGRTKRRVDELNQALNDLGFSSIAIQGDMQQKERFVVVDKFKKYEKKILVATDVMARGIDVDHVEWIVNFDLPQEIEYYTHRIGRAGRAGRAGYSISLVKPDEIEHIKEIAKKTNSIITELSIPNEDEMYKSWRKDIDNQLKNILKLHQEDIESPMYLENELIEQFTSEELSVLLAHFLLKNRRLTKKINLSPEPSIVLKGPAKIRSIKKQIMRFDNSRKDSIKRRNNDKKKTWK